MFRASQHLSSGVLKTVSATFGISHDTGTAASFHRGLIGTGVKIRLSAKRTSLFKSAGASVLSTTGSRGVRISGSNAGYTMFLGSVKSTGYPLHLPNSPSLPLPCVTVCHHISTGLYCCTAIQFSIVAPSCHKPYFHGP